MNYFAIGMTCSGMALGLLAGCILLRVFGTKPGRVVKPKEPAKPKQEEQPAAGFTCPYAEQEIARLEGSLKDVLYLLEDEEFDEGDRFIARKAIRDTLGLPMEE